MTGKIENDAETGFELPKPSGPPAFQTASELLKEIRSKRYTEWREPSRAAYAEDMFEREGWQP